DAHNRTSRSTVTPQVLFIPTGVAPNQGIRRLENGIGTSVVSLEPDDTRTRKIPLKVEDVRNVCPSPRIDRLIRVCHNKEVARGCHKGGCNRILRLIDILILID